MEPGESSLTYTRPEQPKAKAGAPVQAQPATAQSAPAVQHAVAVHVYKYVDGAFQPQGKLGAAVLGSWAAKDVCSG